MDVLRDVISLCFEKKIAPEDETESVMSSNKFGFGGAFCIYFLLVSKRYNDTMA